MNDNETEQELPEFRLSDDLVRMLDQLTTPEAPQVLCDLRSILDVYKAILRLHDLTFATAAFAVRQPTGTAREKYLQSIQDLNSTLVQTMLDNFEKIRGLYGVDVE